MLQSCVRTSAAARCFARRLWRKAPVRSVRIEPGARRSRFDPSDPVCCGPRTGAWWPRLAMTAGESAKRFCTSTWQARYPTATRWEKHSGGELLFDLLTTTRFCPRQHDWLPGEWHSERQLGVFFAATSRFFWLGLARLAQPYSRPSPVLINEIDSGGFERLSKRRHAA